MCLLARNRWLGFLERSVRSCAVPLLLCLLTGVGGVPRARAAHRVAVLPVQDPTGAAPDLLGDLLISRLQELGHATVGAATVKAQAPAGLDLADCWEPACLAGVAQRAGSSEAVALRIHRAGRSYLLSVRRVGADGTLSAVRVRTVPATEDALLSAAPELFSNAIAAAPPPAAPLATPAPANAPATASSPEAAVQGGLAGQADLPDPADSKFRIGANVASRLMNDDISDTPVKDKIDSASYSVQIDMTLAAGKDPVLGRFFVEKYISVRLLKFVSRGVEPDFPDEKWAESLEATGLLYGNRYHLRQNLEGFGLGWYAGVALLTAKGYSWSSFDSPRPYEEEILAPLAAAEFFYRFVMGGFYLEPNLLIAANTDSSSSYAPEVLPILVLGYQF